MKTRPYRIPVVLLTLLAFSACAVTPIGADRAPANAPSERQLAVLQKDSLEFIGLWVRGKLLEKNRARLELQGKFSDPKFAKAHIGGDALSMPITRFSSATTATGILVGMILAEKAFLVESIGDSAAKNRGLYTTVIGLAASAAGYTIGVIVTGSSGGSEHDSSQQDKYFLSFLFRRKVVNAEADLAVKADNAAKQAVYVADLKKLALEISTRLTATLGLTPVQEIRAREHIESQLTEYFRTDEAWKVDSKVRVNLESVLAKLTPDIDERIALFEKEFAAAAEKTPGTMKSAADVQAAYTQLSADVMGLSKWAVENYDAMKNSGDAKIRAYAQNFIIFASTAESTNAKLKLDAKLGATQ